MHHSEMCQPCGDCQWCQHRHELRKGRDRYRALAKAEHAKLERLRIATKAMLDVIQHYRTHALGPLDQPGRAERALRRLIE